jgi:hypothetical protein
MHCKDSNAIVGAVTARHMYAAAAASAPDHGSSTSLISKDQAGNVS